MNQLFGIPTPEPEPVPVPEVSPSRSWRTRLQRIRTRARSALPFLSGVAAALVALLLYNALTPDPVLLTARDVNDSITQAMASATPPPPFSARVYAVVQPSLVFIETRGADSEEQGVGSGVVVDDRGNILTSLHVVDGARRILITFADGTESEAQVVATQPENDIAVLQAVTPPAQLIPATLGNPNAMSVGDEAFAVGNPFGLYSSMSAGVISGFNRTFRPPNSKQQLKGLIQIDAAVNPGNSGGPLLNRYGQVVGIVTGIVNPTEQDFFIGIGFAVPIQVAASAAGSLPY